MNKYELAVVVNAKIEDDARADVIEKVKALITRFGGNVTDIDEWGKKLNVGLLHIRPYAGALVQSHIRQKTVIAITHTQPLWLPGRKTGRACTGSSAGEDYSQGRAGWETHRYNQPTQNCVG